MLLARAGCGAGGTLGGGNCCPGPCDQLPLLLLPLLGLSLSHLQSCPPVFCPFQPCACSPNFPLRPPESVPPPTHWYHSHAFQAPCTPDPLSCFHWAEEGSPSKPGCCPWTPRLASEASWGPAFSPCTYRVREAVPVPFVGHVTQPLSSPPSNRRRHLPKVTHLGSGRAPFPLTPCSCLLSPWIHHFLLWRNCFCGYTLYF